MDCRSILFQANSFISRFDESRFYIGALNLIRVVIESSCYIHLLLSAILSHRVRYSMYTPKASKRTTQRMVWCVKFPPEFHTTSLFITYIPLCFCYKTKTAKAAAPTTPIAACTLPAPPANGTVDSDGAAPLVDGLDAGYVATDAGGGGTAFPAPEAG